MKAEEIKEKYDKETNSIISYLGAAIDAILIENNLQIQVGKTIPIDIDKVMHEYSPISFYKSKTYIIEQKEIIVKIITTNFKNDGWDVDTIFDGHACGYHKKKPQPCTILGFKKIIS